MIKEILKELEKGNKNALYIALKAAPSHVIRVLAGHYETKAISFFC